MPSRMGDQWKLYEMTGAAQSDDDPLFELGKPGVRYDFRKKIFDFLSDLSLNEVKFNVYGG